MLYWASSWQNGVRRAKTFPSGSVWEIGNGWVSHEIQGPICSVRTAILAFSLENYNQKPQQLLRWKKPQWNVFLSWDFSRKQVLSWPAVPIPSLFKGSLFDLDFGCDSVVILREKVRVMVSLNPCGQKPPGGIPIFLKPPEFLQGN